VKAALKETRLRKCDAAYLAVAETVSLDLGNSISLEDLARRPGVSVEMVLRLLPDATLRTITVGDLEAALADNLYAGYIKAQQTVIRRLNHNDDTPIPADLDFRVLNGLSHEMVERLERARPLTFGEARSVPGLTAAALSTLYVAANLGPRTA
jgi:tRNA uridine 5-carboxymethylaminomethyl modification enzyme